MRGWGWCRLGGAKGGEDGSRCIVLEKNFFLKKLRIYS